MPRGSKYGQRMAAKYGLVFTDDSISDNASTTIAETGELVIDMNDGVLHSVDSSTKTQQATNT